MDMHGAKLEMLQNLIDAMTGHMLGGAKKKGTMVVDIKADAKPVDDAAKPEDAAKSDSEDDLDGDALSSLMDMYGKDEEDKKDDSEAC